MSRFPFSRLLDMAKDDEEKAARAMQEARQRLSQSEQQLSMLQQYRQDYQDRLQNNQQQGMSVNQWRDYQLFMSKLDVAIEQQQNDITRCQQLVAASQQAWMQKRQKVQAFDTLQVRHQQAELKKESKQEQKLIDEFAGRVSHHKTLKE